MANPGQENENDQQQQQEHQQEQQQQPEELPALRSIENKNSSFVRFINKTRSNIGVYWIDYQGNSVLYKKLGYSDYLDVNTFVTHPWIFVDEETKDRFLGDGEEVYQPRPWFEKYKNSPRSDLPRRIERTRVYITLPMYTLRDLCLRVIKRRLRHDRHAFSLELPGCLQRELHALNPRRPDNPNF